MKLAYQINNLNFSYLNGFQFKAPDLKIAAHSIVGIIGLNGSGKTTLLKLLAFLLEPQAGEIKFLNQPANKQNLYQFRQEVTLLQQDPVLLKRSVYGNVAYGLKIRKQTNIMPRVKEALARVDLPMQNYGKKYFNELSSGELKRVALASRIALNPRVLLLDEPTTNLDKFNKELLFDTVMKLNHDHKTTVIVSSHDEEWLAKTADTIIDLP